MNRNEGRASQAGPSAARPSIFGILYIDGSRLRLDPAYALNPEPTRNAPWLVPWRLANPSTFSPKPASSTPPGLSSIAEPASLSGVQLRFVEVFCDPERRERQVAVAIDERRGIARGGRQRRPSKGRSGAVGLSRQLHEPCPPGRGRGACCGRDPAEGGARCHVSTHPTGGSACGKLGAGHKAANCS